MVVEVIQHFGSAMRYAARHRIAHRTCLHNWRALETYLCVETAYETIEHVRVLFLSSRNTLLLDEIVSSGTVDHAELHVREVIARALEVGASAIILAHNHPGGDATPSRADIAITRSIIDAGNLMGIAVHDHLIVSASGNVSFRARGLI